MVTKVFEWVCIKFDCPKSWYSEKGEILCIPNYPKTIISTPVCGGCNNKMELVDNIK